MTKLKKVLQYTTMNNIITIQNLTKAYDNGFVALKDINFTITRGEIFALLGQNGAGKTTLISIICGLVRPSTGTVTVNDDDIIKDYRKTRSYIGLVPQEITLDPFLTVTQTVAYARGFYGRPRDEKLIEEVLTDLSLWDKKDNKIQELSGGMKRRVLIAKALMNEPEILFLDEPTAGVDVELRKGMWDMVTKLKNRGTTIILTTHYIEEAQEMADRIGVIADGEIKIIEEKDALMNRLGTKKIILTLTKNCDTLPPELVDFSGLSLSDDGHNLIYSYKKSEHTGITTLLTAIKGSSITFTDIQTEESSLEDIFVSLTQKHE